MNEAAEAADPKAKGKGGKAGGANSDAISILSFLFFNLAALLSF